jgi:ferrous iron transport protein A
MKCSLAELKTGDSATVIGFTTDDIQTHRLMQLGVIEGETVRVVRRAPAGDPIEILVLGYALSLRGTEAGTVLMESCKLS